MTGGPPRTPPDLSDAILGYLWRWRNRQGLNQAGLVERINSRTGLAWTRGTLDNFQRKDRPHARLSIDAAAAIAKALDTTIDELVAMALGEGCSACGGKPPSGFVCKNCGCER